MASRDNYAPYLRQEQPPEVPPAETEEDEPVGFGRVGSRQLPTVTFECRDGSGWVFGYGHFYRVVFADQSKLVLEFSDHSVTVEGSGLLKLRRHLADFRARVVREADARPGFGGDGAVERITVAERKKG